MEIFAGYVHMGTTVDDYVELIGKALQEKDPGLAQRRILFARSHTWENSVSAISAAIGELGSDQA
jgi:hypothetical protein